MTNVSNVYFGLSRTGSAPAARPWPRPVPGGPGAPDRRGGPLGRALRGCPLDGRRRRRPGAGPARDSRRPPRLLDPAGPVGYQLEVVPDRRPRDGARGARPGSARAPRWPASKPGSSPWSPAGTGADGGTMPGSTVTARRTGCPSSAERTCDELLPEPLLEDVLREVVRRRDQCRAVEQTQRSGQPDEALLLRVTPAASRASTRGSRRREVVVGHRHCRVPPSLLGDGSVVHTVVHTLCIGGGGPASPLGSQQEARPCGELRIVRRGPGSLGVSRGSGLQHHRTIACSAPSWACPGATY